MKTKILFILIFNVLFNGLNSQIKTKEGIYKGCKPLTLTFYNKIPLSSYNWNFDNGQSSSQDTASATFTYSGTFNVKVGNDSILIEVLDLPNVRIDSLSPKTGCLPLTVSLKDNSIYPMGVFATQFLWVYGSGDTSTGSPTSVTIQNYEPKVSVSLYITTNISSCNTNLTFPNYINTLSVPIPVISYSPHNACRIPINVQFNNLTTYSPNDTNTTYLWKWGNPSVGQSTSKNINPITYNNIGTYKVTLTATNKYGCSKTDTAKIVIDTPSVTFNSRDSICINASKNKFTIPNYDTEHYIYRFDNANFDVKTIDSTFLAKVNEQGYYNITVQKISKADTNCKTTFSKNILVIAPNPKLNNYLKHTCSFPLLDTLYALNSDQYIDEITFNVSLLDKFSDIVRVITIQTTRPDTIKPINIANFIEDSFYRKDIFSYKITLTYKNTNTNCQRKSETATSIIDIFNGFLISDKTKGCKNLKVKFEVNTDSEVPISSTKWFFGDGTPFVLNNDTVISHTYNTKGKYKAYAVVYSSDGCSDTTNPIWISVEDSIIPSFTLNKTNFCISDTLIVKNTSSTLYQYYYFYADNYESAKNPNVDSAIFIKFRNTGRIPVTLTTVINGCVTSYTDTVNVNGSFARIDYDFKCSRRDSILFKAIKKDNATNFQWDFGDGTNANTSVDSIWHKYGPTGNYWVKLTVSNASNTCSYTDSTLIHIRHVKAKIAVDSLVCKITDPSERFNNFPYKLNPTLSTEADYVCNYNYTWFFEGAGVTQRPITYGGTTDVDFMHKKFTLGLIARDYNGCTDTTRQSMWVDTTVTDFTFNKSKYCMPQDQIVINNLSSSPFGITSYYWEVTRLHGIVYATSNIRNPIFTLNSNKLQNDTFEIKLVLTDNSNCGTKALSKYIVFYRDTNKLVNLTDTVCLGNNCNVYYRDSLVNNTYRWYIDNVLQPTTNHRLNVKMNTLGQHTVKLIKQNLIYGCFDTFFTIVNVKAKPRLRMDNTADTSKTLCFPATTNSKIVDTNANNIFVEWYLNSNTPTFLNPSTFNLSSGVNNLVAIVKTNYGCIDTLINKDTVLRPSGEIGYSVDKICKGDSITFTLKNKYDVDSFVWNFGTGIISTSQKDTMTYTYSQSFLNKDSTVMSLVLYGRNGICPQSHSKTIFVYEAIPNFFRNNEIDTAYCFAPLNLLNKSIKGDYFKWDLGNGDISNYSDILNYQYATTGEYTIKLYAYRTQLGCVDSISKKIILYPSPKLTGSLKEICEGQKAYFIYKDTLINTTQKLYEDTVLKKINTTSPIEINTTKESIYKLVSTSIYGCKDSISLPLMINRPFLLPQLDTIVVSGSIVTLPLSYNPNFTYHWTPSEDSLSCKNCSFPTYRAIYKKEYYLAVTDDKGCFTINTKYIIDVYPDIKVVVPTAFTPNGDGNNDILYARGYGIKKLLNFKIYNRVGQLLFVSHDEKEGWDGSYKGELQNSEPYFYTYEAEAFIPGKIVTGEGNFMLLK